MPSVPGALAEATRHCRIATAAKGAVNCRTEVARLVCPLGTYAPFMAAADCSHGMLSGPGAPGAATARSMGGSRIPGVPMLDVLMLALGALSFPLLARYLLACERG